MKFNINNVNITTQTFHGARKGASECHIILSCHPNKCYQTQLEETIQAIQTLQDGRFGTCLFVRFFLSDAANQVHALEKEWSKLASEAAVSIIQQPPLDGTKIAAWCYFATEMTHTREKGNSLFSHNGYNHIWHTERGEDGTSYDQTFALLERESERADALGITLAENCIRTWFYVQNIDVNYMGMVKARKNLFESYGLTACTHYIASTGIEGRSSQPASSIRLDSYFIRGIHPSQIQYLYALSHLNPTYEYGVTFERGTAVHYGDRKHIFLSGTASIDHHGEILHEGDIKMQTLRMWENCDALLKEAGATLDHMAQILVYLRDTADYTTVKEMFDKRFPETPKVILLAPVCRPGWLIEMEGIAIIENNEAKYPNY